jgi:hypothetical protein
VTCKGQSLISAFGGNDLPWFMASENRLEVHHVTPLTVQKMMVEEMAKGYGMKTKQSMPRIVHYSQPDQLTAAIRRAAGEDV